MNKVNWGAIESAWRRCDRFRAEQLEARLRLEVAEGHALFNVPMSAIGVRLDGDDVLFRVKDGGEFVVVHLTWTRSPPERPPWPNIVFRGHAEKFAEFVKHQIRTGV